jgi:hypothetical protein
MRDPAWTVLLASASLLLGAAAAGPPVRAAGAEQAAEAAQALHPPPYPSGESARAADAVSAPASDQADAEQPDQGAAPAAPPQTDVAPTPEATATQPAQDAPDQPSLSAPAPSQDADATTDSPEAAKTQTSDAIATEPDERRATSAAGARDEGPDAGFVERPAADQPSQATEEPSADALSDQAQQADLSPAPEPLAETPAVAQLANWVVSSGDTGERPFVIIDKPAAAAFLFDPSGALLGAAPALLGSALGDDTAPGVGNKELSAIPLEERTTPAGRFVAHIGPAAGFRSVLWVDVPTATSLHAVITNYPQERRLERLQSPNPDDRRITHGCINVPVTFYGLVHGTFAGRDGIVYILPDTKSVAEVFPTFADASPPTRAQAATDNGLN